MKKIVCLFVATAAMTATMTSYAATYETTNEVSTAVADGMQTVMIYKGDNSVTPSDSNIVYVDQADNTFNAKTKFLIKSSAANAEGLYTVLLGGSKLKKDTFYIGMSETPGDTKMKSVGSDEYVTDGNKLYNVGYTAEATGAINSVIIKVTRDNKDVYMGCNLGTAITTKGTATVGIQVNGLPSVDYIKGIWISPRVISDDGTVTASAE